MDTKNSILLLGAHTSIAEGMEKAFARGESIGCTAIQIFTKSNRQWHAKEITNEAAEAFKKAFKNSSIKEVIVHASYLINIGSPDENINHKSYEALKEEVQRCEKLGLKYLILHPGSSQKNDESDCLIKISENLNKVFLEVPGKTMILLENMAGMGTSIGHKFEQLAFIINQIEDKKRIGICFDTCHAFAAGYDFRTENKYELMWKEFERILDIKLIKAIHLNDSKKECGSKIDRHEHIGKGQIKEEAFRLLINDEKFFDIPKILETPIDKFEDFIPDLRNIVNLLNDKNKKLVKNTLLEQYLK